VMIPSGTYRLVVCYHLTIRVPIHFLFSFTYHILTDTNCHTVLKPSISVTVHYPVWFILILYDHHIDIYIRSYVSVGVKHGPGVIYVNCFQSSNYYRFDTYVTIYNPRTPNFSHPRKIFEKRLLHFSWLSLWLSVRQSAWNNSAPTGRSYVKFQICIFSKPI